MNSEIQKKLKLKSAETGKTQLELANKYILEGLKNDKTPKKPTMTIEEIEKLLDYDLPEGDETTEKLIGLVDNPVETNAVKLKKASYKKS